jgi:hypothetical protein
LYWGRVSSKDKILATKDVRICGSVVRLTHYLPHGQCNVPFLEHWDAAFVAGGWAVYLHSTLHEGGDAKASALDVIRAADLITDAIRAAKVGLDRPDFERYIFEGILWGNQETTLAFSLESARGQEICANLWNRVPKKYSTTGIKGYGTCIIKVIGKERLHGKVATSNYNIRGDGFQLDWADEFGVGGSILHELKPLPALIDDLKHEQIQVRVNAVFELARCGIQGVPALLGALKDKERRVRRVAAIALGRNGAVANEAVPVLKEMREKDPDSSVRREAATALNRIGSMSASALLTDDAESRN